MVRASSGSFTISRFDLGGSVKLAASKQRDLQRSSEMETDPSEFVSIFSPGGTRLTLPPASPAGSEAGGVGSAQSSQTPAQQGAAGSVVQKILGGPSGSIGSVGGGSDTAGSKTGATEPSFACRKRIAISRRSLRPTAASPVRWPRSSNGYGARCRVSLIDLSNWPSFREEVVPRRPRSRWQRRSQRMRSQKLSLIHI